MKYALLLFAFLLPTTSQAAPAPPAGYKLAWSDNFRGHRLNTSKWQYRTDSKLLSTQLPQNVRLQHGQLVIDLKKTPAGGKQYTGGGIISRRTFHYGYFEARIKIAAGNGWHSSFWLQRYNGTDTLGDQATLEMDILENTSDNLSTYSVNTHRWVAPHIVVGSKNVSTPDLSRGFHIFGCEYDKDVIRYYFDGQLVNTVDWSGQPQGEVNLWLTSIAQAMGPHHAVDDTALPAAMYVDWVRFYTRRAIATHHD